MTRKMRARWSQSVQTVPFKKPRGVPRASSTVGTRNSAAAASTTQGV